MLKALLIKTSSLGDVVHNLPVATDIRSRFPDARIDWVVEEAYAPLVALHPAVRNVIPVAIRRWRGRPLRISTWSEVREFRRLFGDERYDAIIDTQGLIKSAVLCRAASGRRHGFDAASARESLAARFYDVRHHVARHLHAVVRNRLLAAGALGYRAEDPVDYGIRAAPRPAQGPYCVLLHATSRDDKLWPTDQWIALAKALEGHGMRCALPWGADAERARSEEIAARLDRPWVPARMPLSDAALLLAGASAVIGVDTGLTHLAAALGVPVVALYCGSEPALTGVYGARRARNLGAAGASPGLASVLASLGELAVLEPRAVVAEEAGRAGRVPS